MAKGVAKADNPNPITVAIERFLAEAFEPGTIVTHEWINQALAIPVPKTVEEWQSCQLERWSRVYQFRSRLLVEHKIMLDNVHSAGYRIVPSNQQAAFGVQVATEYIEKGLHKGRQIVRHTNVVDLTTAEQRRLADVEAKLDSLRRIFNRECDDILRLFRSVPDKRRD
jgi:hypothetical protein